MLKGREIEQLIRSMGYEKAVVHCIRTLAEQQMALDQSLAELGTVMMKMMDSINSVAGGYVDIKRDVQRIERKRSVDAALDD